MNIIPLIVIGALLVVMLVLSNRNKSKRAAADVSRRKSMVVGTRVMTTSGMYGTITAIDPANSGGQADTITLEIAPGVEVEWALAAVREAPAKVDVLTSTATDAPVALNGSAPMVTPANETLTEDGVGLDAVGNGTVRLGKPKGRTATQG